MSMRERMRLWKIMTSTRRMTRTMGQMRAVERTSWRTWRGKYLGERANCVCRDYIPKPELDQYEEEGIDDEEYKVDY
jgi:hypothetical protein